MKKELTKYPQVNELLNEASKALQEIFQSNLTGVYVMGSLTYGDFNPSRSDIDLVVVLDRPAGKKEIEQLRRLHKELEVNYPEWEKRIESQYVPRQMFEHTLPPQEPRPSFGEGIFYEAAPFGRSAPA